MSKKNTFKQIPEEIDEPAPPKVKKGVKSSMSFIRFVMHIAELYLAKVPEVVTGFISSFDEEEKEETDSKES